MTQLGRLVSAEVKRRRGRPERSRRGVLLLERLGLGPSVVGTINMNQVRTGRGGLVSSGLPVRSGAAPVERATSGMSASGVSGEGDVAVGLSSRREADLEDALESLRRYARNALEIQDQLESGFSELETVDEDLAADVHRVTQVMDGVTGRLTRLRRAAKRAAEA